jgi:hypothetical protein
MAAPFLALITPLASEPGGPPPGYWGGVAPPYVDIGLPGPQPPSGAHPAHPIWRPDLGYWGGVAPPLPTHPIAPGGPPPGIWGGGNVPMPTPPIYFPPPGGPPPLGIWGPPDMPPGYWGGGMGPGVKPQPKPEHPIVLPPNLPPEIPPEGGGPALPIDWKVAWTPVTGWVVVGIPSGAHPAPA